MWIPEFTIRNEVQETVLMIRGPCFTNRYCCNPEFQVSMYALVLLTACYYSKVLSADGSQKVGMISKQWSGLVKEYFTNIDNFGINCMI